MKKGIRICTICRKELPLNSDNFYKVKTVGFYGFSYTCKDCQKETRRNRKRPGRYLKRKNYYLAYQKEWAKKNKNKVSASIIVNQAIKKGTLKRLPCGICGDPKSHGHHEDYNKPLDVKWLCSKHHRLEHLKIINN